LLANAPFVGLSFTEPCKLVAAAVSTHEARFDPATDKHNITGFDFLKPMVENMEWRAIGPGHRSG
jgi:hypothetical protein